MEKNIILFIEKIKPSVTNHIKECITYNSMNNYIYIFIIIIIIIIIYYLYKFYNTSLKI